jgi:Zn-finger nucleic acid-binding protein
MLLSCSRCHRQYDVGSHPAGARIRCACGHLETVPEARSRQVEMLHCSNCGGRLESGAPRCAYCSAEVRLADRGLGPACPECLATTFAGARHCQACGVRLAPEGVLRALSDRPCPRCDEPLSECETERARYVECTHCGGLWLDEALFEQLAKEKDRALVPALTGVPPAAVAPHDEGPVRYLKCPVCREIMARRQFVAGSGVVLDRCNRHGWWFDATELERVLDYLEQGGAERARTLRHERRVQELRREQERLSEHDRRPRAMPVGSSRRLPRDVLVEMVEFLTSVFF